MVTRSPGDSWNLTVWDHWCRTFGYGNFSWFVLCYSWGCSVGAGAVSHGHFVFSYPLVKIKKKKSLLIISQLFSVWRTMPNRVFMILDYTAWNVTGEESCLSVTALFPKVLSFWFYCTKLKKKRQRERNFTEGKAKRQNRWQHFFASKRRHQVVTEAAIPTELSSCFCL